MDSKEYKSFSLQDLIYLYNDSLLKAYGDSFFSRIGKLVLYKSRNRSGENVIGNTMKSFSIEIWNVRPDGKSKVISCTKTLRSISKENDGFIWEGIEDEVIKMLFMALRERTLYDYDTYKQISDAADRRTS